MLTDILNHTFTVSDIIIFVFLPYLCYFVGYNIYISVIEFNRKITSIANCADIIARVYEQRMTQPIQN